MAHYRSVRCARVGPGARRARSILSGLPPRRGLASRSISPVAWAPCHARVPLAEHDALHTRPPHHAELAPDQARRIRAARGHSGASEQRRRRGPCRARCRRQRGRCGRCHRPRPGGGRAVEFRPRRHRSRPRPSRRRHAGGGGRFRPNGARRARPVALQVDRADRRRSVRVAAGPRRPQHPWAAVVRHPRRSRRLRRDAPALGTPTPRCNCRTRRGARAARVAAGLVHDAEDRRIGCDPATVRRERAHLSARRAAADAPVSGYPALPSARQARRHARAAGDGGLGRLLRRGDRGQHRRRCAGNGRSADERGSQRVPSARAAGRRGAVGLAHATAGGSADGGPDGRRGLTSHGGGAALWDARRRLVPGARPRAEGRIRPPFSAMSKRRLRKVARRTSPCATSMAPWSH
jgi:hypothetical protein